MARSGHILDDMNPSRIAVIASSTAIAAWATKALVIGVSGGLGESPLEGPLFVIGLAFLVAGVTALVVAATTGRASWQRAVLSVAALAAAVAVTGLVNGVVNLAAPDDPHWMWGEVNLWIVGLAVLALARARTGPAGHRPRLNVSTTS